MTEPHIIRIDSRDLRDLIDHRDRLETSLADCARSAMDSAAEWQAELDKAGAVNADLVRFHRDVQEALGYSGLPGSVAMADLVADIRRLVERQLSEPTRPEFWTRAVTIPGTRWPPRATAEPEPTRPQHVARGDLGVGWSMSTAELGHHQVATPPVEPATPAYAAGGVVPADADMFPGAAVASHLITDATLYEVTMLPLDKFPGWSHDQDSPPAAPHPRTWKAGDPEPATAGPAAVWGVTNELGDLYRPHADEEHGWVWTRTDGTWWRWPVMLAEGPVTETFPPSPTPHTVDVELPAEDAPTPAPEALAVPVASDDTTTTDPAW